MKINDHMANFFVRANPGRFLGFACVPGWLKSSYPWVDTVRRQLETTASSLEEVAVGLVGSDLLEAALLK